MLQLMLGFLRSCIFRLSFGVVAFEKLLSVVVI